MRLIFAGLVLAALIPPTGCAFERLELNGLTCPCGTGYVCEEPTNRCVQLEQSADGAGLDGGPLDADRRDAPGIDVQSQDVASTDVLTDSDDHDSHDGEFDTGEDASGLTPCSGFLRGALYCDTFEAGFRPFWNVAGETRLTSDGLGGSRGVEFDIPLGGDGALRLTDHGFSDGDTLYLRADVHIVSIEGPTQVALFQAITSPGGRRVDIAIRDDRTLLLSRDATLAAGGPLPQGEWFCLRAEIELRSAGGGDVRVYTNDVLSVEAADAPTGNGMLRISVGPTYAGTMNTAQIRMDNVALGTTPLPCE